MVWGCPWNLSDSQKNCFIIYYWYFQEYIYHEWLKNIICPCVFSNCYCSPAFCLSLIFCLLCLGLPGDHLGKRCPLGFPLLLSYPNEPPHGKTNKMICAPSEDSDQPGHLPSLLSLRCPHEETLGPKLPIERTAKTLIRLGGGLGAQIILLVLSWGGSLLLMSPLAFVFLSRFVSSAGCGIRLYRFLIIAHSRLARENDISYRPLGFFLLHCGI